MGIGSVTWEPDNFDFERELGYPPESPLPQEDNLPSGGDKMVHIPKAVCMNLQDHPDATGREMTPIKNGFTLEMITETIQDGFKVDHPYYKVRADLYECPECGWQACVRFVQQPFVEYWEHGYKGFKSDAKSRFR